MKEELTRHSVSLFQQKGFSETSIQDIVDAIGVTKGTFYYYFTSKEMLLMEIHERYIDDLLNKQKVILDQEGSYREKVVGIVSLIIHDLQVQGPNGRIYFREMRNLTSENVEKIKKKREAFRLNVEQVLSDGIQAGEFRGNLHPKMIAFAILGVTNWSYQWFNPSGDVSIEELANMYVDFILNGIISERG